MALKKIKLSIYVQPPLVLTGDQFTFEFMGKCFLFAESLSWCEVFLINFLLVDVFHGYISYLNISGIFLKSMCCFAYISSLNISHGHSMNGC